MTLKQKKSGNFCIRQCGYIGLLFLGKHKYVLLLNLFNFIDILKNNFI